MKWTLESLYDSASTQVTWAYQGLTRSLADARVYYTAGLGDVDAFGGIIDQEEDLAETINPIHKLYQESKDPENFYNKIHELTKSNIDDKDQNGYTLLHKALYNGQPELVRILLKNGADLFIEGPNKSNFLQFLGECKDHKKANQIFNELIEKPETRNKVAEFDKEIYKEVIKICIIGGNTTLAQNLIKTHHSKKALLKELLEDAEPPEEEKTKIHSNNEDILNLERKIYELEVAKNNLSFLEEDLKNKARTLEEWKGGAEQKKRAEILHKRALETFEKEKARIGIILSTDSTSNILYPLTRQIEELGNKLVLVKKKNKDLTKQYVDSIKSIQSLSSEASDQTNKLSFLIEATKNGDSNKVKLLLEAEEETPPQHLKYYNKFNNRGATILNIALKEIQDAEDYLRTPTLQFEDYEKIQNKIKGIYNSINLIVKQPDFNLESALKYESGSLLSQAYIYSKESIHNEDPEIKYQKEIFFKTLFNHQLTKKYLGQPENSLNLLKASAKYNDPDIYFKTYYLKGFELSDQQQNEILLYAAQSGSKRIFDNIINKDQDKKFTLRSREGNSNILMYACKGGSLEIVKTIINYPSRFGIEINQVDIIGNSAIHYLASSKGQDNIDIINELIENGANIEAQNSFGHTPLINAVILGNTALVKQLLAKGADVNAIDNNGDTPLIHAVRLNNSKLIEAILSANELDVSHKNKEGISAYTISLSRDFVVDAIKADSKSKSATTDATSPTIEVSGEAKKAVDQNKNNYPKLSKILLSRGADPYKVSPTTLADVALTTTVAAGAIKVAELLSTIKDPFGVGGTASAVLRAGTTLVAGAVVYNTTSDYVKNILDHITKKNSEKTSLDDEVMIGTTHRGSWFKIPIMKRGAALQRDMGNHPNFKDADKGIFTYEALSERIKQKKDGEDFEAWAIKAQRGLQDKYITTKKSIEESSWTDVLFGGRRALERNLDEITEASKLFIQDNHIGTTQVTTEDSYEEKSFDGINSALVSAIKPPAGPNALLSVLIRDPNDENVQKIDKIIKSVIGKKILVSPDTYYHFCEFEKIRKKTCRSETIKRAFLSQNYDNNFTTPNIDDKIKEANANLEGLTKVDHTILETRAKQPSLLESAKEMAQDITARYVLTENVKKTLSNASGAALTYATVTLADPNIAISHGACAVIVAAGNNIIGSPITNAVSTTISLAGSVALGAASLTGSAITGAASLAANHPVAATLVGATAVAAACYRPWTYFYKSESEERIRLEPTKIESSSMPDLLTKEQYEQKKKDTSSVIGKLWKQYKPKKTETEAKKIIGNALVNFVGRQALLPEGKEQITAFDEERMNKARAEAFVKSDTKQEELTIRTSSNSSIGTDLSEISSEALSAARAAGEHARKAISDIYSASDLTDRDTFSSITSNASRRSISTDLSRNSK